MARYDIIERWVFEESEDPDDESRKEVQIVRHKGHDDIFIRTAYYGPSGRYGQDAPTFGIGEESQGELIDALQKAYPRAREISRREKFEEVFSESEFEADELQKLMDLAEEVGGVEKLKQKLE